MMFVYYKYVTKNNMYITDTTHTHTLTNSGNQIGMYEKTVT